MVENTSEMNASANDWLIGIALTILSTMVGAASKLSIRKSWIMIESPSVTLSLNSVSDYLALWNLFHHDYQPSFEDRVVNNEIEIIDISQTDVNETNNISFSHHEQVNERNSKTPPSPSIEQNTYDITQVKQIYRRAILLRLLGMIGMTTLNPALSVVAFLYANPSILAPFAGLAIVWIVILSPIILKERPTRMQILGAVFILLGEVITAISGDHSTDDEVTLDEIADSYRATKFQFFLLFVLIWMGILYFAIQQTSSSSKISKFAWGICGGSITGLQNFGKDFLTVLKVTPKEESYPWYTPVLFLCAISCALVGLLLLVYCMKRYDATYSSSMFVGSLVISASLMSAVHYDTFSHIERVSYKVLYPLGLMVILGGVSIFTVAPEAKRGENVLDEDEIIHDGNRMRSITQEVV